MIRLAELQEKGLVIASHNAGKVREIGELLAPLSIKVKSAAELNLEEPEETGKTFKANAKLKSDAAAFASGWPALADDSGLSVDALSGAPGIYSARWAGPEKDFGKAMRDIEHKLVDTPEAKRSAQFVCVLSLSMPDGRHEEFEGIVKGMLTFPPRGEKGFGYDPIFIPVGEIRTFAEMQPEEKHAISHRAMAFNLLLESFR